MPEGSTREGIQAALEISADRFDEAAKRLGTGWQVSAQDTVPFCLWCAAHNLHSFEDAIWLTLAAEGDRDTLCAIVGGIVALSASDIPAAWIDHREPLPDELEI